MIAVLSFASIAGGTCMACGSTHTRYERQIDVVSGFLLVAGLAMIGAMLPVWH